ncbi:MAG: hypothetical protein COA82_09030 [Alkaliphilus sp.]|nr:hypothetical protein [Alkaliphilus sp. AH-315-G20]PHS32807.1 MAG: hypothetical protein COA82_09030 [Alkaliphilus sp.]
MDKIDLKYGDKLIYMEGIIVDIKAGCIEMDLKGRLGKFKVPMRMMISDNKFELGQIVGFMMSYPEVICEVPDQHYISNMKKLQKKEVK